VKSAISCGQLITCRWWRHDAS